MSQGYTKQNLKDIIEIETDDFKAFMKRARKEAREAIKSGKNIIKEMR